MKVCEYMGWQFTWEISCSHKAFTGLCPLDKDSTAKHYCNGCSYKFNKFISDRKLDGNDMVLAINAMRDKGDWSKYVFYVSTYYYSNSCFFFEDITFSMFGDPAKFFELMEAWLKTKGLLHPDIENMEGVNEKAD